MNKEENFDLSKRKVLINGQCPECCNENCYEEKDVKEFVKLIRDKFCRSEMCKRWNKKCYCDNCNFINKLAGDNFK
jgi:hypothetical protein